MRRTSPSRALVPLVIPAIAAIACIGLAEAEAEAAPPAPEYGLDGGGYITITPGSLVLTAETDFTDVNPSYGWGIGGGYMFAPGLFKATIGVTFEHDVLILDGYKFKDFGAHLLRFVPEVRLGLGGDTVWGYGLVGAGVAGTIWSWDADIPNADASSGRRSAPGFDLQVGAGLQGIVHKNFFLGAEVDVDVGMFYENDVRDWGINDDDDFTMYQISFEVMMGWYF